MRMSGRTARSLLSEAMTRCRIVPSDSSRLATRACSASAVPIRSSTDGSSRRTSTGTSSDRSASAIVGTTVLPSRASASAASSVSSGRPSAIIRGGVNSSRTSRCAARTACRATSGCPRRCQAAAGDRGERRFLDRSDQPGGFGAIAASLLAGRPRHRLDHEPRRVEVLRGPGAARNAAAPARIEKSSKSPSSWIWRSGSTPASRERYSSASVRTPRSGSRSMAGTRSAIESSPLALRMASERRRISGSGCVEQRPQRRMPLPRPLPFDQIERVADLRRDRRR